MTTSQRAGLRDRATIDGMSYHSIVLPPREDPWGSSPPYVRQAATRKARALRVLRLYRRRGWNESAVVLEYSRATQALVDALDQWEFEESNPTLF